MLCAESAASQNSPAYCFRIMTEADSEDEEVVIVKVTPAPKPKERHRHPLQRLNAPPAFPTEVILISDDEEDLPCCKMSDKRQASPEDYSGPPRYKMGGKRPVTLDYGYSPSKKVKLSDDADSKSGPSCVHNGLPPSSRHCIPKASSNRSSSELRPLGSSNPPNFHYTQSTKNSHSPSRSPHRPANHIQSPSCCSSTIHLSRHSNAKPSLAVTSPSTGTIPPSTPLLSAVPPCALPPRPPLPSVPPPSFPPPSTPPPSVPPPSVPPPSTPPPSVPPPSTPPPSVPPPSVPPPSVPPRSVPPPIVPPPSVLPPSVPPPSVQPPSVPPPSVLPPSVPPPSVPPPSVPPPSVPPPSVPPPSTPPPSVPPPSVPPPCTPPPSVPPPSVPPPSVLPPSTLPPSVPPPSVLPPSTPPPSVPPPSTPPPSVPPPSVPLPSIPPPSVPPPSVPPHSTPPPSTPPPSVPHPSVLPPSTTPPSVPPPSVPPLSTPPPSVPPPSVPPPSVPPPSVPPPGIPPPSVLPPSTTPPSVPPPSVPPPSVPPPSIPPPSVPPLSTPPPSVLPPSTTPPSVLPPSTPLPSTPSSSSPRIQPEPAISGLSTCTSPAASTHPLQPLTPKQPDPAISRLSTSSSAHGRPFIPNIHRSLSLKKSPIRTAKSSVIPMWPLPSCSSAVQQNPSSSPPRREPPRSPPSSSTGTLLPLSAPPTPTHPPRHNHPPSELNPSSSSSSLNCSASLSQPTPSPADPLETKLYVDPPFCCIPPCTQTNCRQFSPHETSALDIYGGSSAVNYLTVMEKLVSQGSYIPSDFLKKVLALVYSGCDEVFVRKMHTILCHDLAIRADTSMCEETVWETMEQGLSTLQRHLGSQGSDPPATVLAAEVILNYLFGLLVKDLNSKIDSPRRSLVKKIFSLRTKWPHISKIIDLLFALYQSDQGVLSHPDMPDLRDVLLALICLPLLTCEDTDRKELAVKLARELSQRLGTLGCTEKKCQFLQALPSDYLREKVISVHLESNFIVHPSAGINSDNRFPSDCISLASIGSVHLSRMPYNHSGVPQDLSLFLSLLCQLLQSHLHTLYAEPILSFLHASTPQDLPPSWRTVPSPLPQDDLQASLLSIQFQVSTLTYRLFEDPGFQCELTTLPTNWLYLQLLTSLAEPA